MGTSFRKSWHRSNKSDVAAGAESSVAPRLQLAPAFLRLRQLPRQRRDLVVQPQRLRGIGRGQQLRVQRALLLIELGDRALQSLEFLPSITFVLRRGASGSLHGL